MFKHVLIPTDGSRLSMKAVKAGMAFAKELGAGTTVYHALEIPVYAVGGLAAMQQFEAVARIEAQKYVDKAVRLARAASVPCEAVITRPDAVHEGIIDAARKEKCDVIFMASHGRSEIAALVAGSVTLKVLAHSKIPVLVFR
ncbi:MAG TPA: universal stress protein [Casimicrobiaceae bacterium]|nr:universal stress protein [Casimicrobiaceae bacterium]